MQDVECGLVLARMGTQRRWQRTDSALLVATHEQVLLSHHFLELGKAHPFGGRMGCADKLEYSEAALIDAAFRQADVGKGPQYGFFMPPTAKRCSSSECNRAVPASLARSRSM